MQTIDHLLQQVNIARQLFLLQLAPISETQAQWKPNPETWNITQITEHLFWAEKSAILGMWKTLHGIREGSITRNLESIHRDMPVQQIIGLTWQEKEIVPAMAAPRLGGPLSFWTTSLSGLQDILNAFGQDLQNEELRLQAHPHPISGSMDFQQRLEFLEFHLERHKRQVAELINAMR